ncbi:MAG TPA: hypothetical protein VFE51_12930 [Verrucomicrobiae bacterium]|nr:hypothetical protein [Verrucomicrobiae bacterium]
MNPNSESNVIRGGDVSSPAAKPDCGDETSPRLSTRFMESLHDRKILHWDHDPATGGRVSVLERGALRRFRTWCDPEKRRTACALQNLRIAARFMESRHIPEIQHWDHECGGSRRCFLMEGRA